MWIAGTYIGFDLDDAFFCIILCIIPGYFASRILWNLSGYIGRKMIKIFKVFVFRMKKNLQMRKQKKKNKKNYQEIIAKVNAVDDPQILESIVGILNNES